MFGSKYNIVTWDVLGAELHSVLLHLPLLVVAVRAGGVGDGDQGSGGVDVVVLALHVGPVSALLMGDVGLGLVISHLVSVLVCSVGVQLGMVLPLLLLGEPAAGGHGVAGHIPGGSSEAGGGSEAGHGGGGGGGAEAGEGLGHGLADERLELGGDGPHHGAGVASLGR